MVRWNAGTEHVKTRRPAGQPQTEQNTSPRLSIFSVRDDYKMNERARKAVLPARKHKGEIMPQYLVANYLPDNFDPSTVTEAMMEEIHALNREMIAAGVRKFACGISPAANAKTVRKQSDGKVLVTDGPYTETKEHMGGFWILEAANMDEALAWATQGRHRLRCGRRGARASFLPGSGGSNEIVWRDACDLGACAVARAPGFCAERSLVERPSASFARNE